MPPLTSTLWPLEPHTRAKHDILMRYLEAWFPILGQSSHPTVIYIDGFAGPGLYSNAAPGSPVLALRAALQHQARMRTTVYFYFVERSAKRAATLREVIAGFTLPAQFKVSIKSGVSFEEAFSSICQTHRPLPPTFAFIDPFGWTGVPFRVISEILNFQSCEVMVTFMYEEVNRFISLASQDNNFDEFFGTSDWRQVLDMSDPRSRTVFLHNLYQAQLRRRGRAKYVRSFEMRNSQDVTDYFLFYATNSLLGLKKMKASMWKVDRSGEFTFSDATDPNQLTLFGSTPDFKALSDAIRLEFSGRVATVREIEEYVLEQTAFRETHYKAQVLRKLERMHPPLLEVINPPPTRRIGTYADVDLKLKFLVE